MSGVLLSVYPAGQQAPAQAQDQTHDAWYYRQLALDSYKAKNYVAMLEQIKRAVSMRPDHATFIYTLAIAYNLNQQHPEALIALRHVAEMGLVYPAAADDNFKSLKDTWADTTSPHGRLMLTVLGGLAEFERELIRSRTGEGRKRAQ